MPRMQGFEHGWMTCTGTKTGESSSHFFPCQGHAQELFYWLFSTRSMVWDQLPRYWRIKLKGCGTRIWQGNNLLGMFNRDLKKQVR